MGLGGAREPRIAVPPEGGEPVPSKQALTWGLE